MSYREQIADLILSDPDGGDDLVVCSEIKHITHPIDLSSAMRFDIQQPKPNGVKYRVILQIEEITP